MKAGTTEIEAFLKNISETLFSGDIGVIARPQHGSRIIAGRDLIQSRHKRRVEKILEEAAEAELTKYQLERASRIFDIFLRPAYLVSESGINSLISFCLATAKDRKVMETLNIQVSLGGDSVVSGRVPHYILPQLKTMRELEGIGITSPRFRVISTYSSQLAENNLDSGGKKIDPKVFETNSLLSLAFLKYFTSEYFPSISERVDYVGLPKYSKNGFARVVFKELFELLPERMKKGFDGKADSRGASPNAYVGRHIVTYGLVSPQIIITTGGRTEESFRAASESMAYELATRRKEVAEKLRGTHPDEMVEAFERGELLLPQPEGKCFIGYSMEPGYYRQKGEPSLSQIAEEGKVVIDGDNYVSNSGKIARLLGEYDELNATTNGGYIDTIRRFNRAIPEDYGEVGRWAVSQIYPPSNGSSAEWNDYCCREFEKLGWPIYMR